MKRARVYKEFAPNRHLKQYIRCYWKFEKTYSEGEFEQVLPDSSYELVYERNETYSVAGKALPRLFFVGQLAKPVDFYVVGTAKSWAVRFFAWGLKPFGNVEAIAQQSWLPASEVMTNGACQVLAAIMDSDDEQQVPAALDDFFMKHLLGSVMDDARLRKALDQLRREKGTIKIKDLADLHYISLRQLSRKMTDVTGRSPHDVASRLRFEQVRDAIMHNPDIPLAFLASQYDYTDQSHLIKEFKRYADMTPSAFARKILTTRPQAQDHANVSFLQSDTDFSQ